MLRHTLKKWIAPVLLFAIGVLLLGAALAYAVVTSSAIPYQDPTPQMQEAFEFHSSISSIGFVAGSIAIGTAMVLALIIALMSLLKKRLSRT